MEGMPMSHLPRDAHGPPAQGCWWLTYPGIPMFHMPRDAHGPPAQRCWWLTYPGMPMAHILRDAHGPHAQGCPWPTCPGMLMAHISRDIHGPHAQRCPWPILGCCSLYPISTLTMKADSERMWFRWGPNYSNPSHPRGDLDLVLSSWL